MSKANRFNVRFTLCNEVFQNDYIARHAKSNKDLHNSARNAPTAVVIECAKTTKDDGFIHFFLQRQEEIELVWLKSLNNFKPKDLENKH